MKKTKNQKMVDVYLEPKVLRLLNHIAKVEGMTPEQVLHGLLDNARSESEAKR